MKNAPISLGLFFVLFGPVHAASLARTGLTRDDISG
jgi:hypothetical protein